MLLLTNKIEVPKSLNSSGEPRDFLARNLIQKACETSDFEHAQSCSTYASLCLSGTGGPRDIPTAVRYFEKLCQAPYNDARACVRLGSAYLREEGTFGEIPRNPTRAFELMQRACDDLGHPIGCHSLAVMYASGDGIKKDSSKAVEYQEKTKEYLKRTGEKLGTIKMKPNSN